MKIIIIEIKALAHVDLAIYTVDGVKCASFVKRGELPTVETASAEEQLIAAGGKLWTSGTKRRIYFNSRWDLLGLECRYYGTGKIAEATLNGEKISNGQARKFMGANCATTYFDLVSNEWEDAALGTIIEATLSI